MARKIRGTPAQRMSGDNRSDHLLKIHQKIDELGGLGFSRYQTVSNWVELIFYAHLSNGDESSAAEAEYHKVLARFNHNKKRAADIMAEMLAALYLHMRETNREALSELWSVYCANEQNSQYFTPWHVSLMMAQMLVGDLSTLAERSEDDKLSIADPCCGGGVMLLAAGKQIPPEQLCKVMFYAQDVDLHCAQICALNMLFFNMNAIIVWGDSLAMEQRRVWQTAHSLAWGGAIREIEAQPEIARPLQEAAQMKQAQIGPTLFAPIEAKPESKIAQAALF